ncbi:hypothetical protein CC86DRAFT_347300 [Ophiobolus disseminans]|uniref:Brl1/Brr6 domain-containing protein n=1 Tax=Ophiobolus disseminans TaxID=1469910 RepID=A0A6A7A7S6_9PLEO|nr:hypothetical protein CC86DRAFT_347300 [Ophiobolus disseminans]
MQRGHRPSTTPMDFEWSNRNGPVDPASPFMNISQQSAKKRPHSVLDSPSKSGFATPNRLRDPDNRPSYFAHDSHKPLPLPPHVQNDAWAPRTPASTYDFSSGGETPNTPAADSDAATPDTTLADKMGRLGGGDAGSPKKAGRRESWLKRFSFGGSPSPTKAPREKEETRPVYSHKVENRIQKKRSGRSERSHSKKRTELLRDYGDDSDNEHAKQVGRHVAAPPLPLPLPQEQGKTYAMSIAGFLHWVEAHPHLPSVLSFYMQLCVNIFLASGFIYILYCAWGAIISDVDIEASKHMSEVLVDIALCAKQYNVNRCDDVVPELEKVCGVWRTCMSRDPKKVARASVTAKTFAMIFNSFVEEFSYKSMVFTAIIIFGGFNLSNWAFGLIRSQQQQHQPTPNPNDFVPQTPHRVTSNSYIEQNLHNYQQQQEWQYQQQHTPYQTPYGGMRHIEPPPLQHTQSMPALPMAPQEGVAMIEDRKTPRKRGYFR